MLIIALCCIIAQQIYLADALDRAVHEPFRDPDPALCRSGDVQRLLLYAHGRVVRRLQSSSDPLPPLPAEGSHPVFQLFVHLEQAVVRSGVRQHSPQAVSLRKKLRRPAAQRIAHRADNIQGLLPGEFILPAQKALCIAESQKSGRFKPLIRLGKHLFELFPHLFLQAAPVRIKHGTDILRRNLYLKFCDLFHALFLSTTAFLAVSAADAASGV